ncbi:MAG: DinB family protein [Anaerolineales bacterium]
MENDIPALAQKLEREGQRVSAFFCSLNDSEWSCLVYAEGAWTVHDVLAHLVTSEQGLLELFEQILQGGSGVPADFSLDRYNASQRERARPFTPAALLAEYRRARLATLSWLAQRTPTELERRGRHPFLGETTLYEMVRLIYLHNQLHLQDVQKALKR